MRAAAGLAAAMQAGRLFAGDGAATQGELVVHYQPVFQTGSQQITAVDGGGGFRRGGGWGGRRPPHAHDRPGEGRDEPSPRPPTSYPSCCRRFWNRLFIAGLPRSTS
jgi:hypothetical protein